MAQVDPHHLFIPVAGSNEVVAIPLDDLPEEDDLMIEMLQAELPPLALWLDFAKAYLAQGRTSVYLSILKEVTGPDSERHFGKAADYERIQALCALAAYHMRMGGNERKDRTKRHDEWQKAASYLNTARFIDKAEQLPHIGLGQLALAKGDLAGAADHFTRAQNFKGRGRTNVMGLVSLANVLVRQKKYSEALNQYSRALREHPEGPPEMRLGLGICLFHMGQYDRARAAYERVLQLDPNNCDALLGLAILEFSLPASGNTNGSLFQHPSLKAGLDLICRAYECDPTHPGVLSMLAQVCLSRGDYEKAIRLASAAAEGTELDRITADSLTHIARATHALGRLQEAYRYYQQASKADPHAPLPLYGLAQLSLLQSTGEHTNAISLLESALTHAPGWNDALKVLGQLYPQTERRGGDSVQHFREAAQKAGSGSEVWEMLADLLAQSDPTEALGAYKTAVQLARENQDALRASQLKAARRAAKQKKAELGLQNGHASQDDWDVGASATTNGRNEAEEEAALEAEVEAGLEPLPPKLLNNAGVLHMRLGDIAAGASLFQEALEAVDGRGSMGLAPGSVVTLGYNRARAREAAGGLRAAAEEYKRILEAFPAYTDCYIRLACIAARRGASAEALDWANKALEVQPDNPDVLALLGWLHIRTGAWKQAEDVFTKITKQAGHKTDAYAWLGLATLNLYTAPVDRRKEPEASKAEKVLNRAAECYRIVLEKNDGNIYAANGLGAVLAERGHLTTAREIFNAVQEAAAASEGLLRLPDVAVNLGNLHLAQQEYVAAIQMYQSTLRRFYGGQDAAVMLYLARAFYDSDRLPEARSTLLKAAHLQPTNHQLRFNIALTMQEYAVRTLRKKYLESDPNKLEELQRAATELAQAHRFYTQLNSLGQGVTGITSKRLDTHIAFCADTHQKAAQHLEIAEREAAALEAKRQQSQKALEAALREKELEQERKKADEAEAKERAERIARDAATRLGAMRRQWAESAALQQAADEGDADKVDKRRKKKKHDAALRDDDEEMEYEPGPEDDEREYVEGDDHRAGLAGTGLLTDDEEEDPAVPSSAAREGEEGGQEGGEGEEAGEAAPGGGGGGMSRLKRRREEGAPAADGAELADDLMEDEDEAAKPVDEEASLAKKPRRAAAYLEDSDEDEEARPENALPQAEEVDEAAPAALQKAPDDLFGSDSE